MVKRGLILGGVLALFGCVSAYAEGADFSIDVSSASLQLTVPGSANIVLNPGASSSFGTASVEFNVATNNPTGYRVLMSVPQTAMLHSNITAANIPTLSTTTAEANFPVNKWGYKTTGDYNPIKLSNEDSAWNNDSPTNGTNHSLTLAAKVDGATAAGTYTNTLNFTVVVNPNAPKLTIAFDGNGADGGSTNAISIFSNDSAALPSSGFTKSGYLFNGWNEKANSTGTGYGAGDLYTAPILTTPQTKTLYAQWVADTGQGAASVGRSLQAAYEQAYVYNPGQFPKDEGGYKHGLYVPHKNDQGQYDGTYFEATQQSDYEGIPANDLRFAIQDVGLLVGNENVCERTTVIGSEAYVLDLRDYTSYHVAKLKDGRCWLLDNLILDLNNSTVQSRISSSNTNADSTSINALFHGGRVSGDSSTNGLPTSGIVTNPYSSATFSAGQIFTEFKNHTDVNYAAASDILAVTRNSKYGIYYNYCAASAGSYCYGLNRDYGTRPDKPNTLVDLDYDICPLGWRIPSGSNSGEYRSLQNAYGNPDMRVILRMPLSGGYGFELVGRFYQGQYGYYWTATTRGGGATNYQAKVGVSYFTADEWNNAYSGASVRCIAK